MNMMIQANVPVKPYLLKFLYHIENLEPGQALDTNNGSLVSYGLKMLLVKKSTMLTETTRTSNSIENEFSGELKFKVTQSMRQFNCFFFTKTSIISFNALLHRLFHEFLLEKVRVGKEKNIDEKEVIYTLMKKLDIEEDISFDAIKKANYRLRKSKNIPVFS